MIKSQKYLLFLLFFTICFFSPGGTALSAEHNVTITSKSAVYVDEGAPTTNMASDPNYLRVGRQSEFGYQYHTLIHFGPIKASDGGALPDGAEITAAKLRLYKDNNDVAGTVNVYALTNSFDEDTVTWKSKPNRYAFSISSKSLTASKGWHDFGLPVTLVEQWANNPGSNYGIILIPGWSNHTHMTFRSDDFAYYQPSLVLTYQGDDSVPPPPPPPPPPPEDNTRCELTYTVSPVNPRPGESVTITVTATDNQAMSYVRIMRGYDVLANREATEDNQRVLEVSFTETVSLPAMHYTLTADDVGEASPRRLDITVPVIGTGTAPVVSITAEWEIDRVVPERYQLIEGDGQLVTITATASDPEGLESVTIFLNGVPHDFNPRGASSFSETLTWVNDEPSRTRFYFYASARDREGLTATAPGESYDIVRLSDITLIQNAALSFDNNFAGRFMDWNRMEQIFGEDECYWWKDINWRNPWAVIWNASFIRHSNIGGHCWGFSTLVNEIYAGRITARELEHPLSAHELSRENTYTIDYLKVRQAGQYGASAVVEAIDQYVTWVAEASAHLQLLADVEANLEREVPGILAIREGSGGHAIVPWMTRRMSDGTTRIYVYDCNRPGAVHNALADFNFFPHFPFLEMRISDWDYTIGWDATLNQPVVWNERIFYFTYEEILGNAMKYNKLGTGSDAPSVTDHQIPGIIDFIVGVFSGNGEVYFEDKAGNRTGRDKGELKEGIPGSMVFIPVAGEPGAKEMYILPAGLELNIHVTTGERGEYNLGLLGENTLIEVHAKSIEPDRDDRYLLEPREKAVDYSLRIMPGSPSDAFTLKFAHLFQGAVPALNSDFIGREYTLENVSAEPGDDITVYTGAEGDNITVAVNAGSTTFDAVLRSTEAADHTTGDLEYIPGSQGENITVSAGQTVVLSPASWSTTEREGKLHVLGESGRPGFYLSAGIGIAGVGVVLLAGAWLVMKRRKR